MVMIDFIKRLIFVWRYKRAVRKANKLAATFRMKFYVLLIDGKLRVVPKQNIRRLIRQRKFKIGTKVADIEQRALYITT